MSHNGECVDDCGCKLVRVPTGLHMEECPLHAAAQELLSACEDAHDWLTLRHGEPPQDSEHVNEHHRVIMRCRGAITKARKARP